MSGLTFVGDPSGRERYAEMLATCNGQWFDVTDPAVDRLAGASALVVDVSLVSVPQARRLRQLLASVPREVPRLLVVDRSQRVEVIHAGVIGGTVIASRPLDMADLAQFLARHHRAAVVATGDRRECEQAVQTAAGSLEALFLAAVAGQTPDHPGLYAACDEVATAIRDDGLVPWLDTVRAHHQGTMQHCLIVAGILTRFGQGLGMTGGDVRLLAEVGLLHDVGKAAIAAEILDKPTALTAEEFAIVKGHPYKGFKFLRQHGTVATDVLSAVVGHHELLDGSGYPYGLSGKAIGDLERITTICDIYGALIERRAYKPEMPASEALKVLDNMAQAGKIEPALLQAFGSAVLSEAA